MQLDGSTIIGDILDRSESAAQIFLSMGMSCVGCPASRGESIREACEVHGVNESALLGKLRAHFAIAR